MKRAAKPKPSPVPEFSGDRLRLLGSLITPRVVELARARICGAELVKGKSLTVPDSETTVKLALIVAHIMNPAERFNAQEEGRMRGMDPDGVNPSKKEGLIRLL